MSRTNTSLDFSKDERQMHTIHDQAIEWRGIPEPLSEILLQVFLRLQASATGNGGSND
jgi:hypothetical protein